MTCPRLTWFLLTMILTVCAVATIVFAFINPHTTINIPTL